MRRTDPPAGWRVQKRHRDGGTTFVRADKSTPQDTRSKSSDGSTSDAEVAPPRKWTIAAEYYASLITPVQLRRLDAQLCVAKWALGRLGIGWDPKRNCYTFPHYDHLRRVVGIGTRYPDGRKRFIKGSHPGLHLPEGLEDMPEPVLIVEGPSDTTACLSMGLAAIGRPNNYGSEYLSDVIGKRECIVIGDVDAKSDGRWPGKEGAEKVAKELAAALNRSIRWALAPAGSKDIREWLARELDS